MPTPCLSWHFLPLILSWLTPTHPSFILEYCKVLQVHTSLEGKKKKDKPQIQAEKKLSTGGWFFNLADFVFQKKKRKSNQIYMKKIQSFFLPPPPPPPPGEKRKKKLKTNMQIMRISADPKTHIRFCFPPSPLYSQVAESGV
jgi:hypothetical protein